ncbi:tyrosine-type recombinase/integrase [Scytonema sp. HK-05]|uniref:tyrosine-type recombinase/integrase n=1 Tax=Scytonema sp. HK-05 TaxID=1137095 RepID=UPI000937D6E5|nr:tyrosine-type recombinase/integrase [Scytonema sp. HK-05]OKH44719.1 integrase [Scytonema sp. HK-05]
MTDTIDTSIVTSLQSALDAKIGSEFADCIDVTPDVISQLLADTRSPNTRRAYEMDLKDFFKFIAKREPDRDLVLAFLHLEQKQAVAATLNYKAHLIKKGLAEATVNRRLAAIKSMVVMGRKVGVCDYSLDDIKGERVETYRDTSGVSAEEYAKILKLCDLDTLKGKRDYAILRLLWDNGLRLNEVVQLNVEDFDASRQTAKILGKGKGTQAIVIDLSLKTTQAICDWLIASKRVNLRGLALFTGLGYNKAKLNPERKEDPRFDPERINGQTIRHLVDSLAREAGITKKMSPHRVRHSAITTVLDKNKGNFREAQRFSRHADPRTLIKYDDNKQQLQKKMTDLLSDLV